MVGQFEALTWDTVAEAGGRLVKLIGDEAMFVFDDSATACQVATQLRDNSPHPVKVGLAHGPVVALNGDYYGPMVNLAARLVSAASPSTVLVSDSVRTGAGPAGFVFESVDTGPLRGFPEPVPVYRLVAEH